MSILCKELDMHRTCVKNVLLWIISTVCKETGEDSSDNAITALELHAMLEHLHEGLI